MKLQSGYETRKARVEMLPLIDIVFLLLLFFIYAMLSMVVHRGVKVELPETSRAEVDKRNYISITIAGDNALYLNKEPVTWEKLKGKLAQKFNKEKVPVFINGDKQADLGLAIRILEFLRKAGIKEVFFATKEEES